MPVGISATVWPMRISQAGALDLRGKEKPLYAQRTALWTPEPMIRIAVSSAEEEDCGAWGEGFRWEGQPGEKKRVSCYTNGPEAELFLNGRSLGKQAVTREGGQRAVWTAAQEADCPWEELLANRINHPSVEGHEVYARVLMKLFD